MYSSIRSRAPIPIHTASCLTRERLPQQITGVYHTFDAGAPEPDCNLEFVRIERELVYAVLVLHGALDTQRHYALSVQGHPSPYIHAAALRIVRSRLPEPIYTRSGIALCQVKIACLHIYCIVHRYGSEPA